MNIAERNVQDRCLVFCFQSSWNKFFSN